MRPNFSTRACLWGWCLMAMAQAVLAQAQDPVTTNPPWFSQPAKDTNAPSARRRSVPIREWLQTRRQKQIAALKGSPVFCSFTLKDVGPVSGMAFDHQPVDDANKNWIPVHYDHGNGLAVADVDGDGLTDVYCMTQLGSNRLYRNLGGGRFEDITAVAGLAMENQICVAAAFGDVDNDGDPDLFVTTVRKGNVLFENLGGGRFRNISREAGVNYAGHSSGAVLFDYNNDGRLDLFVANIGVFTTEDLGRGGFYRGLRDAFSGHLYPKRTEGSLLYQNLGDRVFTNVTALSGLTNTGWSGDATFADLNADGFPDLYVLNMQGDDHYFENMGGRQFRENTARFFPSTPWGAMGIKFFDFNNDGRMDLYVTDMHSDMTDAQTRQFKDVVDVRREKERSEVFCTVEFTDTFLQGASNNIFGNAFYVNQGEGRFDELCGQVGLETYWPWGPSVGDLNADGFEDVLVTAGMGYPYRYGINSLLLNEQGRRFVDAEFMVGLEPRRDERTEKTAFVLYCSGADAKHPLCSGESGRVSIAGALSSRSAALFDVDNDGDLDAVILEWNDRPQVLISNLTERRKIHFLKVRLVGTTSNRDGLGATVKVQAGGQSYFRYHDGKSGYLAQSSLPLYFGLGDAERVERIEIKWPSGKNQVITEGIAMNQLLTVREP